MFIDQYRESLPESDTILGGIITRTVFDDFLCSPECNAIVYSLARDADAGIGPPNSGVFTIFTAVNVEYDPDNRTIKAVKDLGMERYVPRNWCPPSCIP